MIAEDKYALEIFKKFPNLHRLIVQNILDSFDLTPPSSVLNRHEQKD